MRWFFFFGFPERGNCNRDDREREKLVGLQGKTPAVWQNLRSIDVNGLVKGLPLLNRQKYHTNFDPPTNNSTYNKYKSLGSEPTKFLRCNATHMVNRPRDLVDVELIFLI